MENIHDHVSYNCSKLVTKAYSTSFSRAIMLFPFETRQAIYNIYAFVRFADEIVDSFHDYPKKELLDKFLESYNDAEKMGLSPNPIVHSFIQTKMKYSIDREMIDAFIGSMYKDLDEIKYTTQSQYQDYIYGSAEVVGLMCLKVFTQGKEEDYLKLKAYAQSFGSALQKINFLRDIKSDFGDLNRSYFPKVDFSKFSRKEKMEIEQDIEKDIIYAKIGIDLLPISSKFGVLMAYKYYIELFNKIKKTKAEVLMQKRIRVSDARKLYLLVKLLVQKQFRSK